MNAKTVALFKPFIVVALFLFVFIASIYHPIDLDLGWHLKYGEYFVHHGELLRENSFSSTMTTFRWANGSWGTDVISYVIYQYLGGFFGLTVASALLVVLTFFFYAKAFKLGLFDQSLLFPLLILLERPVHLVSFRGIQISLFFMSVLVYLLSKYKPLSRMMLFVPVLILFWVNIHTEVFMGLGLLGLWAFIKCLQHSHHEKKIFCPENRFLAVIFVISSVLTLLNPFGVRIHTTAFTHVMSSNLIFVNQYFPIFAYSELFVAHVLLVATVGVVLVYWFLKRKDRFNHYLPIVAPGLILLILAFWTSRYVWPAYFLVIPLLVPLIDFIKIKIQPYEFTVSIVIVSVGILIAFFYKIPLTSYTEMTWPDYCTYIVTPCSVEAAQFLIDNNLTNNVLTYYDWGGWLIFNYPEIKPTVDGRMHMWEDDSGYSAMAEYLPILVGRKPINETPYTVVFIERTSPLYRELKILSKDGEWDEVYEDRAAAIFKKSIEFN